MKRFDLFGVPFLVNLRGRDKTNSNCGFLFTLILIALSVLMFVYFSGDMINRKNPIVNRSEIKSAYIDDTLPMDTGSFSIKFGLTVDDSLTFYIDETIYTAVAKTFIGSDYLDETVDGCTNFFTLELDVCTSRWGTGQLYCLDTRIPDDMKKCLKDKTQENLFLIVNHQDIYIDFYKCTGNPNCQSLSYINQVLQSGYWVAEYNDWAVDTQNYEKPLNSFPRIVEYGVVANMYKRFVVNLGRLEFISDDGWLLNSPSTQESLYMESTSMDFFVQENYKFFRLVLSSNGNKLQYSRTYDKIQDVIARVSSVFGICLVIIGAFALPMAKATMYETIVNDSYQVKIRSGEKNLMRLKTKKPSKRDRLYKKAATTSLKTTTNGDMLTSGRALKVRDELNGYLSDINSKFNDTPRENIPDANELENLPAICINRVERADSQIEQEQDDELTLQSEIPRRSEPVILPDVLDRMTTNKLEIERKKSTSSGKDSATNNNSRYITSYAPSRFASSPLLEAPTRPMSPISPINLKSPMSPAHCELEIKQREEKQEFLEQTEQDQEEFITMPAEEPSRPFQVTWVDWFKSLFMPNPRVSALEKGIIEINSHTDIRTIINMKRDIENLKCCVFSPQQHALFDNLKKPALYVNTDEKSLNPCVIDVVNSSVSYRGNQRKLREAYYALRKSKGKDDLTKRLLFLYEQREGQQEKKLLDYGKTKTRSMQIMKLRNNSLKSKIIQILGILSIFRLSRKNR